jgi:Xaa-Pro aminopeptidase
MVFTVEPGVYVAGKYGIRIEDDIIVGEGKSEVTTAGVPKEFGWWR